jgi:dTDP-4-dehydrorhamnose reductase
MSRSAKAPDFAYRGTIITGSTGRLGRALLANAPGVVHGWDRPLLDLDDPYTATALVERDRPALVIHSAAMTEVDMAARDPDTAMRRNGRTVSVLAQACQEYGAKLVLVSTNEVFDGERTDGRGYVESDPTAPRNPYGRSKLAGEQAAQEAYLGAEGLWIVRTAWLYGPPGNDFPDKITAGADKVSPQPLPVVDDEIGSPTYTIDLARAIYTLVEQTQGGVFHLANSGVASRYDWARSVLDTRRPGREMRPISRTQFERASDPPPWGVLDSSRAAAAGVAMRPWATALAAYLAAQSLGDE